MMDRRERAGDMLAGLLAFQDAMRAELWCTLPGVVQSFNAAKRTCVVQPVIKALRQGEDAAFKWEQMPLLLDCPVVFPQGGGVVLTFPLAVGDEVLVLFSDRCIDAWYQNGGIQVQAELRMHDLSDGFVLPGPRALPNVEPSINPGRAELRSIDGSTRVWLNPNNDNVGMQTTDASVTLGPGQVLITGELWINGNRYIDHKHYEPDGMTGGVVA